MATINLSDASNYLAGVPAVGTNVKADLDKIVAQCNENLDGDNIALLGVDTAQLAAEAVEADKIKPNAILESHVHFGASTGLLVPRCGPDYDGTGVPRIAVVSKPVTWGGGVSDDVTFTYASNCVHGNPAFTTVPTLLGLPVVASVETADEQITGYFVTASTNLLITFTFAHAASAAEVEIQFGVLGGISF